MKTNKSYTKRIRVTKRGKLVVRKPGQDHFNAKESAKVQGKKRRTALMLLSRHDRARFLPGRPAVISAGKEGK